MIDLFPSGWRGCVRLFIQRLFWIETAGPVTLFVGLLPGSQATLDESFFMFGTDERIFSEVITGCGSVFEILPGSHQLQDASGQQLPLGDGVIAVLPDLFGFSGE